MKIGAPTKQIPKSVKTVRSKYRDIYKAVLGLRNGQWLPVTFANDKEAYNFRVAASTHRSLKIEVKLRGSVVYIRPGSGAGNTKVKGGVK